MAPKRHPAPPDELTSHSLPIVTRKGPWLRIHRVDYPDPLWFGKAKRFRFDDPSASIGVLHAADELACAFVEVFGESKRFRTVSLKALQLRLVSVLEATDAARLVDLRGSGLAKIGADARLTTGHSYSLSQQWSRALHDHPDSPDGILYTARHDPSLTSVALYDRFARKLRHVSSTKLLDDATLPIVLKRYSLSIMP